MQLHEFMHSNAYSAKELQSTIKDFSELKESEICNDNFKAYDGLVDFLLRFVLQLRSRRSKCALYGNANEFAKGRSHINEIVNFFTSLSLLQLQTERVCKI